MAHIQYDQQRDNQKESISYVYCEIFLFKIKQCEGNTL